MLNKILPLLGLAVLALLVPSAPAQAQTNGEARPCGFDEMQRRNFAANPGAEQEYRAFLQSVANLTLAQRNSLLAAPDVTIPVVVHVVYSGPASNITDRQITDAIDQANLDFSKTNPDTVDIIPPFRPLIANVGFKFKLAKLDPNGNCTTGITRINSFESDFGTVGGVQTLGVWDQSKYLNVWVVENISIGAGGYSFLPCAGAVEGIVMRSTQFGTSGRACSVNFCQRSFTHELGHYFGLPHTWGPGPTPGLLTNCNTDDGIADTPNTAGYQANATVNGMALGACTTTYAPCTDANGQRVLSNVQNFMDYADCIKMFTLGQRAVMRASLNLPCHSRRITPANLIATGTNDAFVATPCAPIASFIPAPGSSTTVCAGTALNLRDYSYNTTAAGGTVNISWSFPGGTPATATGPQPSVTYNTPGIYTITETVSNSVGSANATLTVRVEGPGAGQRAPLAESFEGTGILTAAGAPLSLTSYETFGNNSTNYPSFAARWQIRNTTSTNVPAADGSAYLVVLNGVVPAGGISTLVSPNIDLSAATQPATLRFKRAYALRSASPTESLRVSYSSDCGNTWSAATTLSAADLSTQGTAPIPGYLPASAADWQEIVLAIPSAFQGSPRFKVRFQFVNGAAPSSANTFYFDDLRISGPLASRDAALAQRGIAVYPNPLTHETAVHLALSARTTVQVRLTDMLGREVLSPPAKTYGAGQQAIALPTGGRALRPGLYVVHISLDGETFTSKLTVQ